MPKTTTASALAILVQLGISHLPERFKWTAHNIVAHPLSEVLFQLGCREASEWVHDITAPEGDDTWAI